MSLLDEARGKPYHLQNPKRQSDTSNLQSTFSLHKPELKEKQGEVTGCNQWKKTDSTRKRLKIAEHTWSIFLFEMLLDSNRLELTGNGQFNTKKKKNKMILYDSIEKEKKNTWNDAVTSQERLNSHDSNQW